MTTRIEHAVTEVIPEPEPPVSAQGALSPWQEQEKIIAAVSRHQYQQRRLRAEGFDD